MADETDKRADEKGDDENAGVPEVEAELVDETPAASEGAFDADAPTDAPEAELAPDNEAQKPASKSPLTPGIMLFLAFAVLALAAFAVWRFSGASKPSLLVGGEGVTAEEGISPADGPADLEKKEVGGAEGDAAVSAAPAQKGEPAVKKIANAPADDLKTAPEVVAAEEDPAPLPPVSEAGAAKIANTSPEGKKELAGVVDDEPTPSAEESSAHEYIADVEPDEAQAPVAQDQQTDIAASVEMAAPAGEEIAGAAGPADEDVQADAEQRLAALRAELQAEFAEEKRALENAIREERRVAESLQAEIDQLRAALTQAETEAARANAANEEIRALRAEVERLRREQANISARQMRATFAFSALSRAVDQGDPFTEELAVVAEFAPNASAALDAYAASGVVSEAELRAGFDDAARAALAAAAQEKAGGGVAGLIARAQSLISVRPARPMAGSEPGAVLSRAEFALEEGDAAGALLEIESLPPVAQEAMVDWVKKARARAQAEAAIARLQAEISGEAG